MVIEELDWSDTLTRNVFRCEVRVLVHATEHFWNATMTFLKFISRSSRSYEDVGRVSSIRHQAALKYCYLSLKYAYGRPLRHVKIDVEGGLTPEDFSGMLQYFLRNTDTRNRWRMRMLNEEDPPPNTSAMLLSCTDVIQRSMVGEYRYCVGDCRGIKRWNVDN